MLIVPDILSAILGHAGSLGAGSAGGISFPPIPFTCPAGGGGQVECSQEIVVGIPPSFGPPTYEILLNGCQISTGGGTVGFQGTISATGQDGDTCLDIPSNITVTIPTLTVTASGTAGTTTAVFTNLAGSLALSGTDPVCRYDTATLNLTGSMAVQTTDSEGMPISSTQVTFGQGSSIVVMVTQYGAECVPAIYSMTVQGDISFASGDDAFAATFSDYRLDNDASSGEDMVMVSGRVSSSCLGGALEVSTATTLQIASGAPCPQGGAVVVTYDGAMDLVRYTPTGGVEIDAGNNDSIDEMFASCLDPRLFQCPAS